MTVNDLLEVDIIEVDSAHNQKLWAMISGSKEYWLINNLIVQDIKTEGHYRSKIWDEVSHEVLTSSAKYFLERD